MVPEWEGNQSFSRGLIYREMFQNSEEFEYIEGEHKLIIVPTKEAV
jgi:hypothetical protein